MDSPSGTLLDQYLTKTGQTPEQAQARILEKTQKFAGLLTEDAALFLLAKEAGVETDALQAPLKPTPIGELTSGQTRVSVLAIAKTIFPPKTFANKTKPGTNKRQS
ncbi:MAG: DUF2240 family protein, partial [Candidatus Diapherotrites archaeon]|nr:DUF2240 family protein [Candidatus Diapherotrites archaeon]